MINAFLNGLFGADWCASHPIAVTAIASTISAIGAAFWKGLTSDK